VRKCNDQTNGHVDSWHCRVVVCVSVFGVSTDLLARRRPVGGSRPSRGPGLGGIRAIARAIALPFPVMPSPPIFSRKVQMTGGYTPDLHASSWPNAGLSIFHHLSSEVEAHVANFSVSDLHPARGQPPPSYACPCSLQPATQKFATCSLPNSTIPPLVPEGLPGSSCSPLLVALA
jgi:hypothetical protein